MNPNKALWEKGDFTRIAATMRESGEALVERIGVTEGHAGARPRVRRRHDRDPGGAGSAPTCSASTSPATSSRPATGARKALGLDELRFQEGDASDLRELADEQLRPRRQHLRRDVRAEAVRRGQGDGARHAARRPDRHGQLDPERPDAGGADPEDQLGLLAAAAGGLRQPDDVGRRERRRRTLRRAPASRRRRSPSRATPTPSTSPARRRSSSPRSATTTDRR